MPENATSRINCRCNERGYTLLEVVFAISIFAIGILAIASMQTAALMSNRTSRGVTEAVNLAQEYVEELMAIEYDSAAPDAAFTIGSQTATEGDYTVTWTCSTHPTIPNSLNIVVLVTWWESAGQPARVQFNFVKTEEL